MTLTRSLAIGAALLAALAAAMIFALLSAPPAAAHGSCIPLAYTPTKNASTGKIRGYGDNYCTETHTYINVEVCLQKKVNGVWDTRICTLRAASSSTYIDGAVTVDCTSGGHGGTYRTRARGWTSQSTIYSQDGHVNTHFSDTRTFSCP
jgi:hypothetical protein